MYVYTCIYICVCIYVCVCVRLSYIYIYIYIYIACVCVCTPEVKPLRLQVWEKKGGDGGGGSCNESTRGGERKKDRMGKGRQKTTTPLIPKARPSTRVLPPGIAPG